MVNVICMKWGTVYNPNYVNILKRMVARHLSLPHRFVCLTDEPKGIDLGIETLPIPSLGLPNNLPERGWNKLVTFRGDVGDLVGPSLFLDLDVAILDNIDCFFEHPGDFCMIKNWPPPHRETGNSSVFRFEIGASPNIHKDFVEQHDTIRKRFRNDQEYLTEAMGKYGDFQYWPESWCQSFKRHCIPKGLARYFKGPVQPTNAKILVFHGTPKPDQAIHGYRGSVRRYTRPAEWIKDYWR
ncbi:MAG: glycosyltransferase [Pseudomonadota bacterium]